MLIGYAIECALKGLWCKRGNVIVRGGRYIGIPGAGDHTLVQLAQKVGFTPSKAEENVLSRIAKFIVFAGRYPISKKSNEMLPSGLPGLRSVDVGFFSKQDFRTANAILNKVISLISGKKRPAIPR